MFTKPPLPKGWENFSAVQQRAHMLDQQKLDLRMTRLLRNLPQANEQNRQEIMKRVGALDERERESFDRISGDMVRLGVSRDTLRSMKGI